MSSLVQSLSWALVQSFVQGVLVYLTLSVLLWTIPAARSRLRYNLSFFALIVLSCGFFISWWREYQTLSALALTPIVTLSPSSIMFSHAASGSVSLRDIPGYQFLPILGGAYLVGILFMMLRLLVGINRVVSLRGRGTHLPATSTARLFAMLQSKLLIPQQVKLLISEKATVPIVVGVLRPVVLLPVAAAARLDAGQLEAILIHELAHVKRYDYLANIAQAVVETILFFNPFVWLISFGVRDERERCCDDLVVGMVNDPMTYATALTSIAAFHPAATIFAVAATGHSNKLFSRVQRIMEEPDLRLKYSKVMASLVLLAVMACSVAWVKPVFGHKTKKATVAAGTSTNAARLSQNVREDKRAIADKPAAQPSSTIPQTTGGIKQQPASLPDENVLVNRLLQDKVVDQVKGFLVERHFKDLFINRKLLPHDVSGRYLEGLKKDIIRVQVFPMEERMRMHPDADFIQLLLPFTFESPCVEKPGAAEGC